MSEEFIWECLIKSDSVFEVLYSEWIKRSSNQWNWESRHEMNLWAIKQIYPGFDFECVESHLGFHLFFTDRNEALRFKLSQGVEC